MPELEIERATKVLSKAIADLNRETIEFLAHDLGKDGSVVHAWTWNDCPMTLAQRIGNTLVGKTDYQNRSNVGAFASAWDSFMTKVSDHYRDAESTKQLTNGFGVGVVSELARGELRRRASRRKSLGDKILEKTTTACVREALAETEIREILVAMGQRYPELPDNIIKA